MNRGQHIHALFEHARALYGTEAAKEMVDSVPKAAHPEGDFTPTQNNMLAKDIHDTLLSELLSKTSLLSANRGTPEWVDYTFTALKDAAKAFRVGDMPVGRQRFWEAVNWTCRQDAKDAKEMHRKLCAFIKQHEALCDLAANNKAYEAKMARDRPTAPLTTNPTAADISRAERIRQLIRDEFALTVTATYYWAHDVYITLTDAAEAFECGDPAGWNRLQEALQWTRGNEMPQKVQGYKILRAFIRKERAYKRQERINRKRARYLEKKKEVLPEAKVQTVHAMRVRDDLLPALFQVSPVKKEEIEVFRHLQKAMNAFETGDYATGMRCLWLAEREAEKLVPSGAGWMGRTIYRFIRIEELKEALARAEDAYRKEKLEQRSGTDYKTIEKGGVLTGYRLDVDSTKGLNTPPSITDRLTGKGLANKLTEKLPYMFPSLSVMQLPYYKKAQGYVHSAIKSFERSQFDQGWSQLACAVELTVDHATPGAADVQKQLRNFIEEYGDAKPTPEVALTPVETPPPATDLATALRECLPVWFPEKFDALAERSWLLDAHVHTINALNRLLLGERGEAQKDLRKALACTRNTSGQEAKRVFSAIHSFIETHKLAV